MRSVFTLCAVTALAGCTVLGPDYQAPDLDVSDGFVGGASSELLSAANSEWWKGLNDPILNELVAMGLVQNLDIKSALERIVAARINAERFGIQNQIGGNVTVGAETAEFQSVRNDGASIDGNAFFVFDLFGEFERSREQSLADLEAAEFDKGTVSLAYQADLVSSYIQLRYFQTAQVITRQTVNSLTEAVEISRERLTEGEATQIDTARALTIAASGRAQLPVFEAQERVNAFRIATLLSLPTSLVLDKIKSPGRIPAPDFSANTGLPADLLRNRPDIRAAERRLASATAAIGVSEAQLYPTLRLSGDISAGAVDSWSFGPTLILPLLDRSNRKATRDIALSDARLAEIAYQQTFLSAVEEVQTQIALTEARQRQVSAFVAASSSSETALNLSKRSFEAGVVTLEAVLNNDQTRLDTRLDLALAQSEMAQAWSRLQTSVGKGWAR